MTRPDGTGQPDQPDRRRDPVPGQVLGSRRDDEPLLGGAPRRLMVRLLVLAAVLGVGVPVVALLLVDGPPLWAAVRLGTGSAALLVAVGWRVLRVLHRAGRLR